MSFFKEIFSTTYTPDQYSRFMDWRVKDMKKNFTKIFKKNKKINTKEILNYIKKNNGKLNILDDKPTKKTDQFNFTFEDELVPFLFIIFLHEMPERFCIEVLGNDDYAGFLLSSDSDDKNFKVSNTYISFMSNEKPTELAKLLKNKMMKLKNYVHY